MAEMPVVILIDSSTFFTEKWAWGNGGDEGGGCGKSLLEETVIAVLNLTCKWISFWGKTSTIWQSQVSGWYHESRRQHKHPRKHRAWDMVSVFILGKGASTHSNSEICAESSGGAVEGGEH